MIRGVLLVLTLACAASAHAAPHSDRYAIVIGANRGEPDEVALRFAEQDALRMGEVFVR